MLANSLFAFPDDPWSSWSTNQLFYAFDPSYWRQDYQWYLKNTGQNSPLYHNGVIESTDPGGSSDIGAEAAWNIRTESSTLIALIDSGIITNHPDLAANTFHGRNFISRGSDTNAFNLQDTDGHGTRMAGIICGNGNNSIGVCGVCWRANLLICRTRLAYDGLGYEEVVRAMDYAISNQAKIIYLPWGGAAQDLALSNAMVRLLNAGILVVTATPNRSANLDQFPDYPICWGFENVIAVTSLTREDKLYTGDFGRTNVHLGAPGRVLATTTTNLDYVYDSGTSTAAAVVAGAAALVWSQYPHQDWKSIKARILNTVPVSILATRSITGGRLGLDRAITPETIRLKPSKDCIEITGLMKDSIYLIERSENLTDWSEVFEFRSDGNPLDFTPNLGFYRVRLR